MKVHITPPARADLFEIGVWIEKDNPARAATFVEELYKACLTLSASPKAFRLLPGYEKSGIRRYPYRKYLIFYAILKNRVEVLRVLHGARNYVSVIFPST